MVVDDERDVTDLFEGLLREHYEVEKANSGREAIEKLRQINPDLMLIDIVMPGMDGWKVLSKIKARGEYRDIPIIMLTARPDFSIIEKGIEHYIVKPVTKKELLITIEWMLNTKSKFSEMEEAASGASKEMLNTYDRKVKQLISNQRLLSQLRQLFTDRKIKENESQLNLMKSFERAIELEWTTVHRLQTEIQRNI